MPAQLGRLMHCPPALHPLQVDHDFGVTVAVLAEPGGGAPLLVPSRFEAAFESSSGGGGSSAGQDEQQQGDEAQEAAAEASYPDLVSVDSTTLAVESPSPAAALAASTCQLSINGGGGGHGSSKGLILLVPLVLGLGKVCWGGRWQTAGMIAEVPCMH